MSSARIVLLLIFTINISVYSQVDKSFYFYSNAGICYTIKGGSSDPWSHGMNLGGGFDFDLSSDASLIIGIDYCTISFADNGYLESWQNSHGGSIEIRSGFIFNASVNCRVLLAPEKSQFAPYIIFGLGFAQQRTPSAILITNSFYDPEIYADSFMGLSAIIGIGIDFSIGRSSSIFVDGRYGRILFPISAGGLIYLPFRTGIRIGIL